MQKNETLSVLYINTYKSHNYFLYVFTNKSVKIVLIVTENGTLIYLHLKENYSVRIKGLHVLTSIVHNYKNK